jgi:hypothetical protein
MQDELGAEENADNESGDEAAIARKQRNAAQTAPRRHEYGRRGGADRGLREWRNVIERELHRNLIETPGQAQ